MSVEGVSIFTIGMDQDVQWVQVSRVRWEL